MKGRTSCPKCNHEFVLDIPDKCEKHDVVCPKCGNKFIIQPSSSSEDGCSWEEHGEPRKTILSKIKPKTNKPMMATILLILVFSIGITTSAFSEAFIETSLDIASGVGLEGTVEIKIIDQNNESINNATISINGMSNTTDNKGFYSFKNVELGIQTLVVEADGYETHSKELLVTPFFKSENEIQLNEEEVSNKIESYDSTGCSLIIAIFSIFAILGAIVCFKRQHFDVAIAGTILGIFSFGFFLIGSIISIAALIIIWYSKDEFENGKKGKIF